MILRKPYAFLIKHFKLIHILMTLCVVFVLYKTWDIYSFFGRYIENNQTVFGYEDISSIYVSDLLIVTVFVLIVINAIILYLMRHKKKPVVFYIYSLICYSALLILLLFSSNFIYDLRFTTPDLRITKLIKDIYLGFFILQIPCVVLGFIRGIGFDFKKFDFKSDLMDFGLSAEDNAEFEFELGLDTEDLKANARKKFRFFKYYYKENKFIFFSIFLIISIVLVINISNFIFSIETIYKEKQVFETSKLRISVLDSYKTFYDYKGNKINKDKFYVILKLRYYNKSSEVLNILIENAKLRLDEYNSVVPTTKYYEKFSEYGVPYYSQNLNPREERDFIIVYEIKNEYYNSKLQLKYLYSAEFINNQIDYKYRTVNLDLEEENTFSNESIITKKIGEDLIFEDSLLGNTKININNMVLSNSFKYNVILCENNECNKITKFLTPQIDSTYTFTLMRLDYSLSFDNNVGRNFSISEFIMKYGTIRFTKDGKEYNHKPNLKDVTPYLNNNYAFLVVNERLYNAEEIYLDFTIRDKKYTYVIKEKPVEVEPEEKEEVLKK